MKNTNYTFIDNGFLSPFFNTFLIRPLLNKIPASITKNVIPVLSFLFSTLGLVSTLYFGHTTTGVILTSLFQFLYVISSHLSLATLESSETQSTLRNFLNQFQNLYAIGTIHFSVFHFFEVSTPFILIFSLSFNYLYLCKKYQQLHKTGVMVLPKISSWEHILVVKAAYFTSLHPTAHEHICNWIELILLISVAVNILVYRNEIITAIKEKWQFGLYLGILLSFHYLLPDFYTHHIVVFIVLYSLHFIGRVIATHLTSSPFPLPDFAAPLILLIGPANMLTYGFAISFIGARIACLIFKTVATLLKKDETIQL